MNFITKAIENTGAWAPWIFLGVFLAASALMIWRLEAMSNRGFEGTVLGTLVMPYCSGIGNLFFAFIIGMNNGPGGEVMINSLVNNVTNMTLLIGLPAIIWGMRVKPVEAGKGAKRKKRKGNEGEAHELNRLSMLLTLIAVLFFTGATWVLAMDGRLTFSDGLILAGLFLFWQCFHVFDVLKTNVRQNRSFGWAIPLELLLLALGAYATYISIDWLVPWIAKKQSGFISKDNMGLLSGWLMVIPNAVLAIYYAWRGQSEVVYTSQIGDGHICIPLCVGIAALYSPMVVPGVFTMGVVILAGATAVHFLCVALFGGLPRLMGIVMLIAYAWFLKSGVLK